MNTDNEKDNILDFFVEARDKNYKTNEEANEEKKENEEKKKIFNLVVNIMFKGNQTNEIQKYSKDQYDIEYHEYMDGLVSHKINNLLKLIFEKVDKIYEKLYETSKSTKEEQKQEERKAAEEEEKQKQKQIEEEKQKQIAEEQKRIEEEEKNKKTSVELTTEKKLASLVKASLKRTSEKEKEKEKKNDQDSAKVDGGSFPPPTSKKYKLVKK